MAQKTKPNTRTTTGRTRKKTQDQPEEIIRLLKEMDDHLSSLGELYNQYREASEKVMRKLDRWEERFGRFDAVAARLREMESELRDLTRGYLERIEALERRQANIEVLERRLEQLTQRKAA